MHTFSCRLKFEAGQDHWTCSCACHHTVGDRWYYEGG